MNLNRENIQNIPYLNTFKIENESKNSKWLLSDTSVRLMFSEPVGSVKPNVNNEYKTNVASVRIRHQISLLCPAQAFPVPAHR